MKKIIFLSFILLFSYVSFSQELPKKSLPAYQTKEELNTKPIEKILKTTNLKSLKLTELVVPGEFEESQAVLVTWPYPPSTTSNYNILWSKLINTIQKECPAWILVDYISDSTTVKSYLKAQGVTLNKYKFLAKTTDAFWTRDFGPWGVYYSNKDSLGFIDLHYYDSRPNDDAVPAFLANKIGIPYHSSNIHMEGGNFMVDGFGKGFFSSRLDDNNTKYNYWTPAQTEDSVKHIFNLSSYNVLTSLTCDGGTGHIDMYSKLMDEQTLVITQYPSSVTASDKQIIENNTNIYKTLKSTYNRPYRIYRAPMPTADNGSYNTSCTQISADARGYTNGLFVNKTYIMPCFSSTSSGYVKSDTDAVRFFRKVLPGYRIVPIDSRLLTPLGGAIHCITMQIPANNPIRYWHPTVDGTQPSRNLYHIIAKITNKDGIDTASCLWRFKNTTVWKKVLLHDSSGYFIGNIPNLSTNVNDTIQYYLSALSHNGKRMTKPITAPNGYYTLWVTNTFYTISGKVNYNNTAKTPIKNANVYLTDAENNIFKSVTADASGNYTISGVVNGNYKIYASSNNNWGGADPTDALIINKYFVKLYNFSNLLSLKAADVNSDLIINSTDALYINRRFVSLISSFPSGNWLSENINITINNANATQIILMECFGDVNSSFKP